MNAYVLILANITFIVLMWIHGDWVLGLFTTGFCTAMICAIYSYNRFVIDTIMRLKQEIRRLGGTI